VIASAGVVRREPEQLSPRYRQIEFGAQCLESGEPTDGNRGRRAGLGPARSGKELRIHLAFALDAIELLPEEFRLQRSSPIYFHVNRCAIEHAAKDRDMRSGRSVSVGQPDVVAKCRRDPQAFRRQLG
jgi:hypothetical protein